RVRSDGGCSRRAASTLRSPSGSGPRTRPSQSLAWSASSSQLEARTRRPRGKSREDLLFGGRFPVFDFALRRYGEPLGKVAAGMDVELAVDMGEVPVDGMRADEQGSG